MASAPQNQSLPLFYNQLEPLSSQTHADWKVRSTDRAPFLVGQHAVPVTVEEFPLVQRRMPIVFSVGDDPVPLALMGLNEGVNTFLDDEGRLIDPETYVPAYIRRYPYLLARLRPESEELSLCFDPTSDVIGQFDEGDALFDGDKPSEVTQQILAFNEQFEQAGQKTGMFMKELKELGLLMDGEVSIQQDGNDQPFVYRGFQMVSEEKLMELRGDQLRKMQQSGMLPLVFAHLFSLSLMRDVFARQMRQGKVQAQPVGVPTF
ncbi:MULTISPECIES: SapC family protein [unclassified Sphingomonas]|uniref:SapC family protein n=1 Tax=unclassified Sphingomonas TaxID=196159 RepID=UPI0006FB83CD|nr:MULTISPECIES: SapC family protein [unclassified Sphingomonas]KQN07286.1 multidrug transporter [Sphingomonas sp. Leaf25]KQN34200.1 multidrug transporter [Sphingomonas sp. Leaf42]KQT30643.1 multidrug transporter [Sphingomonas sp. Leaf407]